MSLILHKILVGKFLHLVYVLQRAWKDKLDSELFAKLQRVIFKSHTAISFESFADFYYKLVEGTVDDKASVVFSIVNPKNEDCADLSALQSVSNLPFLCFIREWAYWVLGLCFL